MLSPNFYVISDHCSTALDGHSLSNTHSTKAKKKEKRIECYGRGGKKIDFINRTKKEYLHLSKFI